MSQVVHQIHDSFKSFTGSDIGTIAEEISAFVSQSNVAAKSIGIVHVNSANELLFSLGYRDDEPGYPVELKAASLGHIETLHADGLDKLDEALSEAAGSIEGIICHELLVSPSGEFTAVFLTHVG